MRATHMARRTWHDLHALVFQPTRAFSSTTTRANTAADVETGARAETKDVTRVDALLGLLRSKESRGDHRLLPMRSCTTWRDTLRASSRSSPSLASTATASPFDVSPGTHSQTVASQPSSSSSSAQPDLTPRPMSTSHTALLLPFASSPALLDAYTSSRGAVRTGMLMEHLDALAGSIAYRHVLGDGYDKILSGGKGVLSGGGENEEGIDFRKLGFYIVTASVDRLDILAPLNPVTDLRLSGQVIYTGRSSMEVVVRMEALEPEEANGTKERKGKTVMLGRFSMVCRDSVTHKARPVPPLVLETKEDEEVWRIGEAHKERRARSSAHSLARVPPSSEEAQALHALFLDSHGPEGLVVRTGGNTKVHEENAASVSAVERVVGIGKEHLKVQNTGTAGEGRVRKVERIPIGQTRLEKVLTMYPQERNVHQKIFGGYLMRLAYELGYSSTTLFTRGAPVRFLALDSISFAKPVPIGSVLHLTSHILHTKREGCVELVHVGVKATVIDTHTGIEHLTNDFRFTWCREDHNPALHQNDVLQAAESNVERVVVPVTYEEAMWWVEGKRALDLGAEIRAIRFRQNEE